MLSTLKCHNWYHNWPRRFLCNVKLWYSKEICAANYGINHALLKQRILGDGLCVGERDGWCTGVYHWIATVFVAEEEYSGVDVVWDWRWSQEGLTYERACEFEILDLFINHLHHFWNVENEHNLLPRSHRITVDICTKIYENHGNRKLC